MVCVYVGVFVLISVVLCYVTSDVCWLVVITSSVGCAVDSW